MSNILSTSAVRVATVRKVGAGIRLSETTVPEILASVPEGYDWTTKGAVPKAVHVWACGDDKIPAQKTGPKGNQTITDYGRGVDALVSALRTALKSDKAKPVRLAVTMSGEGAPVSGTVTVPADHPMYAALVALLVTQTEGSETATAA